MSSFAESRIDWYDTFCFFAAWLVKLTIRSVKTALGQTVLTVIPEDATSFEIALEKANKPERVVADRTISDDGSTATTGRSSWYVGATMSF